MIKLSSRSLAICYERHSLLCSDPLSYRNAILFFCLAHLTRLINGLQHLDIIQRCSTDLIEDSTQDRKEYLEELEEAGKSPRHGDTNWLEKLSKHTLSQRRNNAYVIIQAELACEKLKEHAAIKEVDGVKIWNGVSTDKLPDIAEQPNGQTEPADAHVLERDFTIPGTPSKLNCPFAKVRTPSNLRRSFTSRRSSVSKVNSSSNTRHSRTSSFRDPIQAEICGRDSMAGKTPEVNVEEATTAVCPIRFLDQHKPEEVASYFEKHKHEIPRSHEVCIKRFQSNADQIRQLDNKYGNLVSMIQGLGQKHQPLLPLNLVEDEEDPDVDPEDRDVSKIQKWANTVNNSMENGEAVLPNGIQEEETADLDEDRESRFDRPMKEVRVGESPSRPWGIQVPLKYSRAGSVISNASPATASPQLEQMPPPTMPAGKCPFDHTKMQLPGLQPPHAIKSEQPGTDIADAKSTEPQRAVHHNDELLPPPQPYPVQADPAKCPAPAMKHDAQVVRPTNTPQMVFSGPVFIGYSPDQIKELFGGNLANMFNKS
ncbi:hypothetical protein EJ05DRAFT_479319 [Pseudovirgaria hyperparasitica]|uniref:Uncharacterized protein n=1 Tax=Pseudovirgaria hyperparasitica TaxID=470096 RepID=A0A6A6VXG1_9PEZI|nr:uncharacterized protein EJ05DRAFT_479319 [Pseudovirgaria hyperparasitica]KAF2754913.1 hypothetical protein EJ05DRAFT_479319 [Pseudovirgaria hyperparasitica]